MLKVTSFKIRVISITTRPKVTAASGRKYFDPSLKECCGWIFTLEAIMIGMGYLLLHFGQAASDDTGRWLMLETSIFMYA